MTPNILWSVFTLVFLSIIVPIESTVSSHLRVTKIEDSIVKETKNPIFSKIGKKVYDNFPHFESKKLKNPTLFDETSTLVFQTPSLYPSTYALTSDEPTTSSNPSLEDSVNLISVITVTAKESNENLIMFLSTLAQKKNLWKKYLLRILKCDSPTQPPVSLEAFLTNEPTPKASSNPLSLPSVLPSVSLIPSSIPSFLTNEPTPKASSNPSSLPSVLPSVSLIPSSIPTIPEEGLFDFRWKVNTDDIEKVFETEAQIEQSLKTFLNHLLRCKNALIKDVKLLRDQEDQEGLIVKGICSGFRKSCIISLSEDVCNDNSLIDDFVAERMLEISSSFDYELDLSVSFDFDDENIKVVPDFISEVIFGALGGQRVVANGPPEPPEVNSEAILFIKKDGTNSNFQNEITFKQNSKNTEGSISLSTEDLPLVELIQSDDAISKSSYFSPKNKCGDECLDEKKVLETIFAYYAINFDANIDVCFWDDINCIDGSVTQIFIRKYENQCH